MIRDFIAGTLAAAAIVMVAAAAAKHGTKNAAVV